MIHEFIASWPLFHNSYLAGALIGVVLSLIGVFVVARDQIFLGAAVSQASTLGVALALGLAAWLPGPPRPWLESDVFLSIVAVAFSVAAALVTGRSGERGRESHEAVTGWVFLISAAASVLVVAHSPHGLEEVQRLLASSILGAERHEVVEYGILAAVVGLGIVAFRRRLLLLAMDPAMAAAVGMRPAVWSGITFAGLGLVVGLSIRTSGMLFAFGCLVLPALAAKNLCREVQPMWIVSPVVVLVAAGAGFVVANHYDFPPAQMTVALLGLAVAGAWIARWLLEGTAGILGAKRRRAT